MLLHEILQTRNGVRVMRVNGAYVVRPIEACICYSLWKRADGQLKRESQATHIPRELATEKIQTLRCKRRVVITGMNVPLLATASVAICQEIGEGWVNDPHMRC